MVRGDVTFEADVVVRGAVEIRAEIALPLELNRLSRQCCVQCGFHLAAGQDFERVRIEIGEKIAACAGVGRVEKRVVEADLRRHGMRC